MSGTWTANGLVSSDHWPVVLGRDSRDSQVPCIAEAESISWH